MADFVYDPLKEFRDNYFPTFKENLKNDFEQKVADSGINIEENRKLCTHIYTLEKQRNEANTQLKRWKTLRTFLIIFCIIGIPAFLYMRPLLDLLQVEISQQNFWILTISFTAVGILSLIGCFPLKKKIATLKDQLTTIEQILEEKKDQAWEQTTPLLSLFTWRTIIDVIQKTIPILKFDTFFSQERYDELEETFGPISFLESSASSTLGAQSGTINGNPYGIFKRKCFEMGEKQYVGTKTIFWTETEYVNGKRTTVSRSEVLYAYVHKPFPLYHTETMLVYGNDAAPNLRFSKEPNSINAEDGVFKKIKQKRQLRSLKKLSANLTDDSNYTLMSNHDFEVRFNTTDRDNETEYRLLFTPVAQRQMLDLLTDKEVGYGDDFFFYKRNKINIIQAHHLDAMEIETDPAMYYSFDFDVIKRDFTEISENFFRGIYFVFAPILAIPIYQHTRSQKSIYEEEKTHRLSAWECEIQANFRDPQIFNHPQCATQSILKVNHHHKNDNGEDAISILSQGFSTHNRVDIVPVYGGDGRWHNVHVDWVEYLPVERETKMTLQTLWDKEAEGGEYQRKEGTNVHRNIRSKV